MPISGALPVVSPGSGDELIATGAGLSAVVAGTGHDLIALGDGAALLFFAAGAGDATVTGWRADRDFLGGGDAARTFGSASLVGGSTVVTLGAGGPTVTFAGVTQLERYSFV